MTFGGFVVLPEDGTLDQKHEGETYLMSVCLSVSLLRDSPQWARASSFKRFLDHIRRTTVDRTPLDE